VSLACQFNDDDALDWTASPYCCPLGIMSQYKQFSPHNEVLILGNGSVYVMLNVIKLKFDGTKSMLCNISYVLPFLVKFLEVIKPFCAVLPEIQKPERKV